MLRESTRVWLRAWLRDVIQGTSSSLLAVPIAWSTFNFLTLAGLQSLATLIIGSALVHTLIYLDKNKLPNGNGNPPA